MRQKVTVLAEYQRLEAEGLWRAAAGAQRRDVIVSIGEATLTIAAPNGTALTHWSLPAVARRNPGERPAVFGPGSDTSETLELQDAEMIEAINRVLAALRRPERRSRWVGRTARLAVLGAALAASALWLPGAITTYTARLVPEVAQVQIGSRLLAETERVAGAPCRTQAGDIALRKLAERLFPGEGIELVVLPSTLQTTAHLPGGAILLSHTLVEDYEAPETVAGFALAEHLRAESGSTLGELLEASPFRASLALLSTGHLRDVDLQRMAERLVVKPPAPVSNDTLLAAMQDREVATAPYGLAVDISGESTVMFVASALAGEPVLSDTDWIALQTICSE